MSDAARHGEGLRALPSQGVIQRRPGTLDMSGFESAVQGPDARGPRVQWLLVAVDGRVSTFDDEDLALSAARAQPRCRLARRYVRDPAD